VVSVDSKKMAAIVLRTEDATVFFSEFSQVTLKDTNYFCVGSGNFILKTITYTL
jgi:hypothetical protein